MTFNSLIFIVFALFFFVVWPFVKKHSNARWGWLVLASFFFYGWWDWRFLFLIIGSGILDFYCALLLNRVSSPWSRKFVLILSLLGNIGSLAAFKYSGFIAENLDAFFATLGYHSTFAVSIPDFMLILPVGISFYTFQSMSYTIDVYRREITPTSNILHFFAYLAMFPQLVAGPIVRASDLLPQLKNDNDVSEQDRWDGTKLILFGFFKKMVIADTLAQKVNAAFDSPYPNSSSLFWWLIISAFAVQIYCDFSGYSDIARGLARWMGYRFPLNFNHPYTAKSLSEFW